MAAERRRRGCGRPSTQGRGKEGGGDRRDAKTRSPRRRGQRRALREGAQLRPARGAGSRRQAQAAGSPRPRLARPRGAVKPGAGARPTAMRRAARGGLGEHRAARTEPPTDRPAPPRAQGCRNPPPPLRREAPRPNERNDRPSGAEQPARSAPAEPRSGEHAGERSEPACVK